MNPSSSLHRFFDFARTEAPGTDSNPFDAAAGNHTDPLQVGQDDSLRLFIGMADVIADCPLFSAYKTTRHYLFNLLNSLIHCIRKV